VSRTSVREREPRPVQLNRAVVWQKSDRRDVIEGYVRRRIEMPEARTWFWSLISLAPEILKHTP
jgi:hypothetical protein